MNVKTTYKFLIGIAFISYSDYSNADPLKLLTKNLVTRPQENVWCIVHSHAKHLDLCPDNFCYLKLKSMINLSNIVVYST